MLKKETIKVTGTRITVITSKENEDYIFLTDMAGDKDKMKASIVVSKLDEYALHLIFQGFGVGN
ncbi:MAG: hypothetical protein LBP85_05710 [Prevotellaceae bacterium]|jgi:hypothetical protein|nr:hypothetical protein [Prevotellaceae bacterium]